MGLEYCIYTGIYDKILILYSIITTKCSIAWYDNVTTIIRYGQYDMDNSDILI